MHHLAGKPLAVGAFGTSFCYIRLPLLKILATALHVPQVCLNINIYNL